MAINGTSTTHQSGIVRSVNDKGLKFEGADGWLNYSKFAQDVTLPERGSCVTVTLDSGGFIRRVDAADGSEATMSSPAPQSAAQSAQQATSSQRERTITRLAVLKAAAEFGAARPNLKSGDVLAIAASWERWINREQDNTYDLTDAF